MVEKLIDGLETNDTKLATAGDGTTAAVDAVVKTADDIQEAEDFRRQVQLYLLTGEAGSMLTPENIVSLNEGRNANTNANQPWYKREWENFKSLWS